MSAEGEREDWEISGRESGTEKLKNFSSEECDKLSGREIFFDTYSEIS